jgi:hypothetical protein
MIRHMFRNKCDSHGGGYMWTPYVKATTHVLNIWLCNNIFHIQDYIFFKFPSLTHKHEIGTIKG